MATRLDTLYSAWRRAISEVLARGQEAGSVRRDVQPDDEAVFLVATIAGTASTAKTSQNIAHYQASFRATERYLDSLRA
jgi:TetR/AcrR family transcriptional repressor of nem operon